MTLAWSAMVGDHTDKLVLLALADNANDEGECYPSLQNISMRCEMHRSTVVRAVQSLEAAGHISRTVKIGRNTAYNVHPLQGDTSRSLQLVAGSNQSQGATNPSHKATPPLSPSPPITPSPSFPSENRHKPSKRTRKAVADEPPPSNLNVEAWHRWVQYRQEIRKPIHPASQLSAQRKLAGFGADQSAVVEQSIADGYQGLFALKPASRQSKASNEWT
jgi:DNA-binding transcriptional MocR family regulator